MYEKFFGFKERPFQLVPNPAYLFLSRSHEEVLAHLTYAVSQGDGFVEITGEVGTGKTTLCRVFFGNLGKHTEAAYIFNPMPDAVQLLKAINDEFGIDSTPDTVKALIDILNQFLMQKRREGRQVILLIDEAQNLSRDVLEQIRLLSNLETDTRKLIQIILVGQPELRETLDSYELRQLAQRITLSCHLTPLTMLETYDYIDHRIRIASNKPGVKFTKSAIRHIFTYSGGTPRLVNIACDRALLTAYGLGKRKISGGIAKSTIRELAARGDIREFVRHENNQTPFMLLVICLLLFMGIFYFNAMTGTSTPPASIATNTRQPADTVQVSPSSTAEPADSLASNGTQGDNAETATDAAIGKPSDENLSDRMPDSAAENIKKEIASADSADETPVNEKPMDGAEKSSENVLAALTEKKEKPAEPMTVPDGQDEVPAETENKSSSSEKTEIEKGAEKTEQAPFRVMNLRDYLADQTIPKTRQTAIHEALSLWQSRVTIPESLHSIKADGTFFLLAARNNAFSSYTLKNKNIDLLKKLNIPAVMPLQISGKLKYLTLTQIEKNQFVFQNERVQITAGEDELKQLWNGLAYLPWKNFHNLAGIIPRNASKDMMMTLKMILTDIGFKKLSMDAAYDDNTREAIKTLQRHYNLTPDGAVGPLTKIILYNEVGVEAIPHLQQAAPLFKHQ